MTISRKKLIEVALPLEAINKASVRESYIYRGNPSAIHKWWAQRPLAAARAVIFAQMVDDPSGNPDLFPSEKAQEKERQRLFKIIEQLVQWESTTDEEVLEKARAEIWQSWRRACADNVDHLRATELFNRYKIPTFHDPFAGGGSLPLEAQRLGLEAYAYDFNPVAALICKTVIEFPQKFADKPPVNPKSRADKSLISRSWQGTEGLAEDVRHYGQWMRDEAQKRIGALYPKVEITPEMAIERPDLKPLVAKKLTAIAWLWVRTVKSPNPAFANVHVPLASTFMLSTKSGKEAYVEPVFENGGYRFVVRIGTPKNADGAKHGTKLSRGPNFQCLMSRTPIAADYIKAEGKARRMGRRLMAVVVDGERGRLYLPPSAEMESIARSTKPEWIPDVVISGSTQYLNACLFGLFQRIRNQCQFTDVNGMLFFDEGHKSYIRLYRMAQKYLPTGSRFGRWESGKPTRNLPLSMFPKDGNMKNSGLSYFMQIADLVCYSVRLKLEHERGKLTAKRVRHNHHIIYDSIPGAQLNTLATCKRPDAIVPT